MHKTAVIFGGTNGFGNYLAEFISKKKIHTICFGRKKKKLINSNIIYQRIDIFEKDCLKKIFNILKKNKKIDYLFFCIGDSLKQEEKLVNLKLFEKILHINLYFTIKIINYFVNFFQNSKTRIFVTGSTSIDNLKAKPSLVISKAALLYYVKTQKFFLDRIKFQIFYLKIGPLLHKNSYWHKISIKNKKKFKNKLKHSKFYHPRDYFRLIENLMFSKKNLSGKIFNI
jgi:short-subunit dehydrogenase involved in D-alanine esterification of teichoic acids